MKNNVLRRENETDYQYKIRLFQNRKDYDLTWDEVAKQLNNNWNGDHQRKVSYGYIEAYKDIDENKFDKSILFLNDIHLPFERSDVKEIIKRHKHEITELVISGDLMDCRDISVFPHDNSLPIIDEIKYTYNWLKEVSKILNGKPIVCCKGNHCERFSKLVLKDSVLQNFIDAEILRMFQDGFYLFENNKKVKYNPIENFTYINKWYIEMDKKIISCHPKNFSNVPASTLEKTCEHFINKGLDFIPELIIMGHTHKYSMIKAMRKMGVYGIENGCMCDFMDYADNGNISYTPQVNCYTIAKYNLDEKLDINNVRTYFI